MQVSAEPVLPVTVGHAPATRGLSVHPDWVHPDDQGPAVDEIDYDFDEPPEPEDEMTVRGDCGHRIHSHSVRGYCYSTCNSVLFSFF